MRIKKASSWKMETREYAKIHGVLRAQGNDGKSLNSKQYGTDWKKEAEEKDTAAMGKQGSAIQDMSRAQG